MKYELKPMGVGGVLDTSIRVFFDNFVPLCTLGLLGFVSQIPLLVVSAAFGDSGAEPSPARLGLGALGFLGSLLITLAVSPFVGGGVIKLVGDRYLGKSTSAMVAIKHMVPLYWGFLGTAMLASLYISLAMLLLIVPGLVLALRYAFAYQTAVLEGTGGGAALRRSGELTDGYKWKLLGLLCVVGVITGIFNFAGAASVAFLPLSDAVKTTISSLFSVVPSMLASVVMTVTYFTRRCAVEGFDLQLLASRIGGKTEV